MKQGKTEKAVFAKLSKVELAQHEVELAKAELIEQRKKAFLKRLNKFYDAVDTNSDARRKFLEAYYADGKRLEGEYNALRSELDDIQRQMDDIENVFRQAGIQLPKEFQDLLLIDRVMPNAYHNNLIDYHDIMKKNDMI